MRAALGFCLTLAATPVSAQTCNYIPKGPAEEAMRYLPEGGAVQSYCAPCRDRRAKRIAIEEAESRPIDTYYQQILINGDWVDPAYLYVPDPLRPRRWINLGLLVRCHEEDDVPPTLPTNKVAE